MKSAEKGFTLLEMLIAMGLLTFVLTVFVVMIAVATQITIDNQRDLQRTYAELSILEMVRAEPRAFFADWSADSQGFLTIGGLNDEAVWEEGWEAHLEHEGTRVTVEVKPPNEG
ncbi:MAG: type IV pilus modification PilV family protein [Bacillota bacterium]